MAGNDAWISNPMNRNSLVEGSKMIVRDAREANELIMEHDLSYSKAITSYNLGNKHDLEQVHEKLYQWKHVGFVPFDGSRNNSEGNNEFEQDLGEELTEEIEIESLAPRNYVCDSENSKRNPEDPEGALSKGKKKDCAEDFRPKSYSEFCGQSSSKEKKRPWKLEALEPGKLWAFQLRKKCRYGDTVKPKLAVGDASEELAGERVCKVISDTDDSISKHSGSIGKRRHRRWGPELDVTTVEGDSTSKRKKTKCACDDSQLKMLGPINLPDFMRDSSLSELDPEVKQLKLKLTEINRRLQSSELHDDRPEAERSPSPEPLYNNLGIRINTHEVRLRKKLTDERASIICMLVKKNPTFKTPPKPMPNKFLKKIYVPVKEYPTYNFIGLIIGPRGNTQKKMEKETGAKISLRGKGSTKSSKKPFDDDDLHVYLEADDQKSLDAAVVMIEKLLIPVADGKNIHKKAQLAELAKLNGTYEDENRCNICRDEGHRECACSDKFYFIGISCDACGSFCHPVSSCPLCTSSLMSRTSWSSSEDFGLTPNMKRNSSKGIDVTNLYVSPLPKTMESKRLEELFLPFGKISEAKVIKDRSSGLSKGYGFVKFENPTDAAAAVAHLNGYKMDGKVLVVRVAGHMALSDYSSLSNVASSNIQCQAACFPLSATSLLPQTRSDFTNDENISCPFSSICSGHEIRNSNAAADDFLLTVGSRYRSSNSSSGECTNQNLYAPKFPSNPPYPGYQFQSNFTTPMVECSPNIPLNPVTQNCLSNYQNGISGRFLNSFEDA